MKKTRINQLPQKLKMFNLYIKQQIKKMIDDVKPVAKSSNSWG